VKQLTVHMISTQIVTVTYMVPLGVCEAISIRLGNVLPQSATRAKTLCFWYCISGTILFAIMSSLVYICRSWLYQIFTTEEDIIQGCEEIWFKVCLYIFVIGVMSVLDGITTAIGKQWIVGILVVILLWLISLPLLYYFAIYKNGGLNVAWECIWPPNLVLDIVLALYFVRLDWDAASEEARLNESDSSCSSSSSSDDDEDDDEDDDNATDNPSAELALKSKNAKNGGMYGSISQEAS
jgi:Na+-driven multidrug efflux pump